jgi:hypothetical protein
LAVVVGLFVAVVVVVVVLILTSPDTVAAERVGVMRSVEMMRRMSDRIGERGLWKMVDVYWMRKRKTPTISREF